MLEALLVSTAVVALGRAGRQDAIADAGAGGALPQALADHRRHPRRHARQSRHRRLGRHTGSATPSRPNVLRWGLALSFFAVAAWALKPDQLDEGRRAGRRRSRSVFAVTVVAFFLAEMGDKTQIATVMLAAKFDSLVAVVAGTTLGMLLVDVPTVFIGDAAAQAHSVPRGAHRAAALFAALGVWVLVAPAAWRVAGRYNRRFTRFATVPRLSRSSPMKPFNPEGHRGRRAGRVDRGDAYRAVERTGPHEVLLRVDAALPVRAAAHGPRAQLHDQRHDVPAPADERHQLR